MLKSRKQKSENHWLEAGTLKNLKAECRNWRSEVKAPREAAERPRVKQWSVVRVQVSVYRNAGSSWAYSGQAQSQLGHQALNNLDFPIRASSFASIKS